jgi:hypothetical protein
VYTIPTKAACIAVCWQENTTLIAELSDLRRELKVARKKISGMESTLGTSSSYTRRPASVREYQSKMKVSLLDNWKEAHKTGLG